MRKYFSVLKSNRGFSIIGVLVAGSIGIVLVMGLNQMLSNIVGTIKSVEDRARRTLFNERLAGTICEKIPIAIAKEELLKAGQHGLADGATAELKTKKIPLKELSSLFSECDTEDDEADQQNCRESRLSAEYNIYGDSYVELSSESESCAGKSSGCKQNWEMKLVTQGKSKGVYMYEKPLFFEFDVTWSDTSADPPEFECGGFAGEGAEKLECLTLESEDSKKRTLIGCGTTQDIGGTNTIALGEGLSIKSIRNSANETIFIGSNSGKNAEITQNGNIFLGRYSGADSKLTGGYNLFLGNFAGWHSTASSYGNSFVGFRGGYQATVQGYANDFIGYESGRLATVTGNKNGFFGYNAGRGATISGDFNTFLGTEAGGYAEVSGLNVFLGALAGRKATVKGTVNTFIGYYAGREATVIGYYNTFMGYDTGKHSNISGNHNYFFGYQSGQDVDIQKSGEGNIFIGNLSGKKAEVSGSDNYFFGYQAGQAGDKKGQSTSISGDENTFFGTRSGTFSKVSGDGNQFIGLNAGHGATVSGNFNNFFGNQSGENAKISSDGNHFFGYQSGQDVDLQGSEEGNIFIGNLSGKKAKISGSNNYFFGYQSGQSEEGKPTSISGNENIFFGTRSGNFSKVSSDGNQFIGLNSGHGATVSANYNNFFGDRAGENAKISSQANHFLGWKAGYGVTIDSGARRNTFVGSQVGKNSRVRGSYNTFVGYGAGKDSNITGGYNTFVGYGAGHGDTVSYGDEVRSVTNIAGRILMSSNQVGIHSDAYKAVTDHEHRVMIMATSLVVCNPTPAYKGRRCTYINNEGVHYPSSKTYKRNIKLFNKFEKALEDILATPLFYYNYKEDFEGDHPEKRRMGIIAEELPENLQLKADPIKPDWPSIYGTLWAGIKALHAYFVDLKEEFSLFKTHMLRRLDSLRKEFMQELASVREQNILQTKSLNQELKDMRAKFSQSQKELSDLRARLEQVEGRMEKSKKRD